MNFGIMYFLRWIFLTNPPSAVILSIIFMIPGVWEYVASMWLSRRGRNIFKMWVLRIPPVGLGLVLLGWLVHMLCHIISALLYPLGFIGTGEFIRGLRDAVTSPWFLGMESIDFAK